MTAMKASCDKPPNQVMQGGLVTVIKLKPGTGLRVMQKRFNTKCFRESILREHA